MTDKEHTKVVHPTQNPESIARCFENSARIRSKGKRAWRYGPGRYIVQSTDKTMVHVIVLIWFGGWDLPVVYCNCTGGEYWRSPRGDSLCWHALVVVKRLRRHREELTELMDQPWL